MISENLGTSLEDVIAALVATLGLGIVCALAFGIFVLAILMLVARIKLFKKCGKEGWKAIIPFYSSYVFIVEICELHWAWFVVDLLIELSFITTEGLTSIIKVFVSAMCFYNLAIKGNKDKIPAMIFGGIFSGIMTLVYGLGSYQYNKEIEVKKSGLF